MIKIPTINIKNNYTKSIVNAPVANSYTLSFGQNKYDFFEKGMLDNKKVSSRDDKYSFLESERINTESINEGGYVKASDGMTLSDGLIVAGFVGVPFILSIALASAIARQSSPEDIFLSDGTYFCNVKDMAVKSSNLNADGDDGILKIKGTGINIDKSRYDAELSNPEKGIFKSADGKLDIDLINNKYIDQQNGIIVDPDHKISAFMTSNGELKSMPLPNFGSGYPTNPWADDRWSYSRPETEIELSFFEKIESLIKGETASEIKLRKTLEEYDKILNDDQSTGTSHLGKNTEVANYINAHNINEKTASEIIDYAYNINLKEYMLDKYPNLADIVNIDSIDNFLQNIHSQGVDFNTASGLMDIINSDSNI